MVTTRWWLVRHAPVARERPGTIVGRTDVPARLPIDAAELRQRLPAAPVWVVSAATRALQTASALGAANWIVEPDLREQDFGSWEGATWAEVLERDAHAAAYLAAYDQVRPPRGECLADVRERVWPVISRLAAAGPGPDVVLVMHAGPIRCVLAQILGIPLGSALKLSVDPLSLSLAESAEGSWQVRSINESPTGCADTLE